MFLLLNLIKPLYGNGRSESKTLYESAILKTPIKVVERFDSFPSWTIEHHPERITNLKLWDNCLYFKSIHKIKNCINLKSVELYKFSNSRSLNRMLRVVSKNRYLENLYINYTFYDSWSDISKKIKIGRAIGKFANLKKLDIWGESNVVSISNGIGNLQTLQDLEIHSDTLKHLPSSIGKLRSLNQLEISCKNLQDLSMDFSSLQNLETLYIVSNSLRIYPKSISELSHLKYLRIGQSYESSLWETRINDGRVFPLLECDFSFEKMKELRRLNICGEVTELPAGFKNLKKINTLTIEQLDTLAEGIFNSDSLTFIALGIHYTKHLPAKIGELPRLQGAVFSDCVSLIGIDSMSQMPYPKYNKFPYFRFCNATKLQNLGGYGLGCASLEIYDNPYSNFTKILNEMQKKTASEHFCIDYESIEYGLPSNCSAFENIFYITIFFPNGYRGYNDDYTMRNKRTVPEMPTINLGKLKNQLRRQCRDEKGQRFYLE